MSYVALSDAKLHLAISHGEDDALIQMCIDAAESHCSAIMNRVSIVDVQPVDSEWLATPNNVVPKSVVHAVLMYTAEFYEQRTVGISGTIYSRLPNADALLHFQRLSIGI